LNEIRGEMRALDAKFTARIEGLQAKMDAELRAIHSEINRLDDKVGALDKRMDITERLDAAEAKVRELEARR
jgi:uncharacterized protein YicC (UPF0701 family)